jgi:RNA polymerase sigma-70 factor (ECF subfamily)
MSSDEQLIERWRAGDASAGEQLFDRHFAALQRFFTNKLDSVAEADDMVQRTFLACLDARDRFEHRSSFRTYLFAIAHKQLLMELRRHRRKLEPIDPIDLGTVSVIDLGRSPTSVVAQREEQRLLLAALRRLPIECQIVLELHYWEALSSAEIGVVVGAPAATVRSRIVRARSLISRELEQLGADTGVGERVSDELAKWALSVRELL